MMSRLSICMIAGCLFAELVAPANATDWGDLTATFVVGDSDQKLQYVTVWIYLRSSERKGLRIHRESATAAGKKVIVEVSKVQESYRVVALQTKQHLTIKNDSDDRIFITSDGFLRNGTKYSRASGTAFLLLKGDTTQIDFGFRQPERLPGIVNIGAAKVHLMVTDHPYVSITDPKGRLKIKNIPVGEWTFQVWHPDVGYVQEVEIDGVQETWRRGRKKITIDRGSNDLGTIAVNRDLFQK